MRSEQGKDVLLPLEKKNIYISRIYRFEVGTGQSRHELLTTTRKVYRVGMARNKISILQLLQCA